MDLHTLLREAEEKSSPLELDQIAFVLAKLLWSGAIVGDDPTNGLPKLKVQVDDCLKDMEGTPKPRVKLVLLEISGWRDREDRLGRVTDYFMRRLA